MRIIGGKLKGKKIFEPKDKITRPLKDLTKESIFNILGHSNKFHINLKDAIILDLFAGVGSFGLETLSRGSKKVVFIENYINVLEILKKNISNLKLNSKSEIIKDDIFENDIFKKLNQKFDIIFLDPPFKEKKISFIFSEIKKFNILKKNGILIVHRNSKQMEVFPKNFSILDEKKYGISKIIFGNFID